MQEGRNQQMLFDRAASICDPCRASVNPVRLRQVPLGWELLVSLKSILAVIPPTIFPSNNVGRVTESGFVAWNLLPKGSEMNFPKEILDIVKLADKENPSSIEDAVAQAKQNITSLPAYASFVDMLVTHSITEMVYDSRHQENWKMKRQQGDHSPGPRASYGTSDTVREANQSLYLYRIGGSVLGMLTGSELIPTAENEEAVASGHLFNAKLCRKLRPLVPDNAKVKDKVSEKKLKAIFRECGPQDNAA